MLAIPSDIITNFWCTFVALNLENKRNQPKRRKKRHLHVLS